MIGRHVNTLSRDIREGSEDISEQVAELADQLDRLRQTIGTAVVLVVVAVFILAAREAGSGAA